MQDDDVGAVLKRLQSLNLPERGLVVVDFLEGDGEVVGEAAGSVDVGVGA